MSWLNSEKQVKLLKSAIFSSKMAKMAETAGILKILKNWPDIWIQRPNFTTRWSYKEPRALTQELPKIKPLLLKMAKNGWNVENIPKVTPNLDSAPKTYF